MTNPINPIKPLSIAAKKALPYMIATHNWEREKVEDKKARLFLTVKKEQSNLLKQKSKLNLSDEEFELAKSEAVDFLIATRHNSVEYIHNLPKPTKDEKIEILLRTLYAHRIALYDIQSKIEGSVCPKERWALVKQRNLWTQDYKAFYKKLSKYGTPKALARLIDNYMDSQMGESEKSGLNSKGLQLAIKIAATEHTLNQIALLGKAKQDAANVGDLKRQRGRFNRITEPDERPELLQKGKEAFQNSQTSSEKEFPSTETVSSPVEVKAKARKVNPNKAGLEGNADAVPFDQIPLLGLFYHEDKTYLKVGNSTGIAGFIAARESLTTSWVEVNLGLIQTAVLTKERFKRVKLVIPGNKLPDSFKVN